MTISRDYSDEVSTLVSPVIMFLMSINTHENEM